ncbi:hypothetical protein E2C01_022333 [Portunus trituberculatus]|uniref:Uncharacterized protein n=1 Tax=Portunus trituberculatus TaxID=210409 RepID=A0A5B7E7D6_PORTR|nr:hypothetical protein [Portunus trituberculatus]
MRRLSRVESLQREKKVFPARLSNMQLFVRVGDGRNDRWGSLRPHLGRHCQISSVYPRPQYHELSPISDPTMSASMPPVPPLVRRACP